MPPSGRKGKTRVRRAPAVTETHVHEPSDAETAAAEALATPSRGSRKRTRGTEVNAPSSRNTRRKIKDTRGQDRDDTEGTEPHEPSDNDTDEPSSPSEQEIIQSLKVSDKHVNAVNDLANELLEGQESVPGYGKIAGRDWVFIIRKIEVNIGRPEQVTPLPSQEFGHQPPTPSHKSVIDIDLGPDRQVSRLHAVITYDADDQRWYIIVNGRNGLRVDSHLLKRGTKGHLRNGSVIEIANTQMAFITTATQENDGPVWDASIIKQAQKSSEDDEGEDDPRNPSNRNAHAPGRSHLQDTGMYQSDYNGQQHGRAPTSQHRTHPQSRRALQITPGTPMRVHQSFAKSSPAANYARGVMMESTESIDYSADGAKDLKPPHSYAQLIGMAILSTTEQQITLNNIYNWIMTNYAFYRFNTGGWQNSIRHNLSLNKAFVKIARRTDEPGKGMKWMIEPTEFDNFVQQGMKGCRRPNPIPGTQSTLGSPNSPIDRIRAGVKRDDDTTPPLKQFQTYPTAMEAYTPERGPRRPVNGNLESSVGLGIDGNALVDYEYPHRSTPRTGLNAVANAAGSPPALYVNDEGRSGPLDTPFPLRPSQRLAPPSTLRRPSDYIQFSSPAPFWKMQGLTGSTPFKPFDLSPFKTPFPSTKRASTEEHKDDDDDPSSPAAEKLEDVQQEKEDERNDKGSPIVPSSSPPRANSVSHALDASPTLSRPATAVAKTLSQLANAAKEPEQSTSEKTPPSASAPALVPPVQQHTPPTTVSSAPAKPAIRAAELPQTAIASNFGSMHPSTNPYSNPYAHADLNGPPTNGYHQLDDGDDDGGIDLAKGFQPIGVFHQRNHMQMGIAGTPSFGR